MKPLAHVAAFLVGATAVLQLHLALGPERVADGSVLVPTAVLGAACLAGYVVWGRMRRWSAYHWRELVGTAVVIAALGGVVALWEPGKGIGRIEGWQWVGFVLCLFAVTLQSQQSFLMFLVVSSSLLLVGQSFHPSSVTAAAFLACAMALLAALVDREKVERFPAGARRFRPMQPLFLLLPVAGATALLLAVFLAVKPPATVLTAEEWMRWLKGEPAVFDPALPAGIRGGPVARDPIRSLRGGIGPVSFDFETDMKFGDRERTSPDALAFLATVVDDDGAPVGPSRRVPYWASSALTEYDGRRWKGPAGEPATLDAKGGIVTIESRSGPHLEQRFIVAPFEDRSLFVLSPVAGVRLARVALDAEGMVRRAEPIHGWLKYGARSRNVVALPAQLEGLEAIHPDSRYVRVPESVREAVAFRLLASELSGEGADAHGRVQATLKLLESFEYVLVPRLPKDEDPTLAFLRARRGYCQHFASAMALLLREQGIPTRVIAGFAGGDWDVQHQYYTVRRRHAHCWVEVHFERFGWVAFDPAGTPVETLLERDPAIAVVAKEPELPPSIETPANPVVPPVEPAPKEPETPAGEPGGGKAAPTAKAAGKGAGERPPVPAGKAEPKVNPTEAPVPDVPEPVAGGSPFDSFWAQLKDPAGGAPAAAAPAAAGPVRPAIDPWQELGGYWPLAARRDLSLAAVLTAALLVPWWVRRMRRRARARPARSGIGPAKPGPAEALVRPFRREEPEPEVVRIYLGLLEELGRRGYVRAPHETPLELARRAPLPAVAPLTAIFMRARYGREAPGEGETREAERHLRELRGAG